MKFFKVNAVILIFLFSPVYVFADSRWMHITEIDRREIGIVWSIATSPDGSVWFGADGGLFRYNDGQWEIIKTSPIEYMAIDSEGIVWITEIDKGEDKDKLSKLNNGTWTSYNHPDIPPYGAVGIRFYPKG
ncbi:unnamed protein product [marine sediment metagenome]|uniref:Two component regulator propeller n=1 Tax=marine sediment metagenome TaxID=412755 RepID=X0S0N0_9ZZZZ